MLKIKKSKKQALSESAKNYLKNKRAKKVEESCNLKEDIDISRWEGKWDDGRYIIDRDKLVQALKYAAKDFIDNPEDGGCFTFPIDDRIGVVVGWESGYDADDSDGFIADNGWHVVAGLKCYTSDDMRTDYEWINFPYFTDGEVIDYWEEELPANLDDGAYRSIADYLIKGYEDELSKYEYAKNGEIIDSEIDEDDVDDAFISDVELTSDDMNAGQWYESLKAGNYMDDFSKRWHEVFDKIQVGTKMKELSGSHAGKNFVVTKLYTDGGELSFLIRYDGEKTQYIAYADDIWDDYNRGKLKFLDESLNKSYRIIKKDVEELNEDVRKEWKPDTSFKHIKKVLDDAIARGKYVNNEREEVLAAVDKADKGGYTPEQRRFIRDKHADMWRRNRNANECVKEGNGEGKDKFEGTPKEYVHADRDLFLKKLQQRGHRKPIVKSEEIPLTDVKESKGKGMIDVLGDVREGKCDEDAEIKRYSDVVPKEKRRYWYFTTHGVQPGSVPKGVNVLEVRDGVNDRGTKGTFVLLDAILNTSELKDYDMRELAPKAESCGRKKSHKKMTEAPIYDLSPRYDSRNSFYGKARVDTGDKNDQNKLYSYNTLVAEIKDGKPVVYGTYSATTLRHIKDWLKQNGFKAETAKQIMKDYAVDESCKRESIGEDVSEYQKWVDYDMKKYHKISKDTMDKIKSAGLSVVKDQYGDYEVIADRPVKESCGKKR